MSRRKGLRLLAAGVLTVWLCLFLHWENTEKSMIRALLVETKDDSWTVGLLYQFPEASADSSEAEAAIRLCVGRGTQLSAAIAAAEKALPQRAAAGAAAPITLRMEHCAMNQNEALVKSAIHDAVIRAVTEISADVKGLLKDALARETNETAQSMLRSMVDNLSIAKEGDKAVCQSPGYPTTWLSFGDGNLPECAREAVSEAVAEATKKGYLRPSMVDPLTRENSGNNTGKGVPNIEYEYHPGQKYVDFIISFKGCGAELGNAMQIMTTAKLGKNLSGLKRFILETAVNAGGKPCPPYGIGIGIGGQMDIAAKLSRKAISTRRWDDVNPDPELAALEAELKDAINGLGLGAAGTGGDTVCLALKMERAHTHTAIAPVAINFHCWVARRAGIRIYDDGRVEKLL